MDIEQFLHCVWPSDGYKCVLFQQAFGKKHLIQSFHPTIDAALLRIEQLKNYQVNIFYALSSFKSDENRTQANVQSIKSYWLDVDCGEGKPYPDQLSSSEALVRFCHAINLPLPYIVNSGGGLHAYWPLITAIDPIEWKDTALKFKNLCKHLNFHVGPERTADSASVLRPINTLNYKYDPPKIVQLQYSSDIITSATFQEIIDAATTNYGLESLTESVAPVRTGYDTSINKALMYEEEYPPISAHVIADQCKQLSVCRDTRGNISEPFWFGMIGLLKNTLEAPQIIHDWSNGHPKYTSAETNSKISWQKQSEGATTCRYFDEQNPGICNTCPHFGKIKSPIVLGYNTPTPPQAEAPQSGTPEPTGFITSPIDDFSQPAHGMPDPLPFIRSPKGVYVNFIDVPAHEIPMRYVMGGLNVPKRIPDKLTRIFICKFNVFISDIRHDNFMGGQTLLICFDHPKRGKIEFTIPSHFLASTDLLHKELFTNHLPIDKSKIGAMQKYLTNYVQRLQKIQDYNELYGSMGWHKDKYAGDQFVLGPFLYQSNGTTLDVGLSESIAGTYCDHFAMAGDVRKWVNATEFLGAPGLEAHAFGLLLGFGAPLMHFHNYCGALVSLYGDSNAGKTMMSNAALSIYGNFQELKSQKDDTINALFYRLGVFQNLPFVIDEITNIDNMRLSDFIYTITQGRQKTRLTRAAKERKDERRWNTLVISTSNNALRYKLYSAKGDPIAEQLRLFEYRVDPNSIFEQNATPLRHVIEKNYGHVGDVYIKYLVEHQTEIKNWLIKIQDHLMDTSDGLPAERYWYAVASASLLGGHIAQQLGLIKFNVNLVQEWVLEILKSMRKELHTTRADSIILLASYLDETIQNRLVIEYPRPMKDRPAKFADYSTVLSEPKGALYVRFETFNFVENKVLRAYINRQHIQHWMTKRHLDFTRIQRDLKDSGILLDQQKKKVLGSGWNENPGGGQIRTWEIDLGNPKLGNVSVQLLDDPIKTANANLTNIKGG